MKQTKSNRHFKKSWKNTEKTIKLLAFLIIGLLVGINGDENIYGTNASLKYFKNYSTAEYGLHPQNWCILQDHQGIIYVANQGGLLEYDSIFWNSITMPNKTVRSIAVDNSGTIYVGGVNELGFLSPDKLGRLEYISLIKHLEDKIKKFGNVWKIHATEEGIFYRTSKFLFHWNPGLQQMKVVLESKNGDNDLINGSFTCNRKYYVNQLSVGLMEFQEGAFKLIPEGEIFASVKTVFMIVPYDTSGLKLLIGTRERGFFIFDGHTVIPFPTELASYLKEQKVCYGIRLSHQTGDIAIATLRGGLVITDINGKLKYLFTKNTGLPDNNVKYIYEDTQGSLWAALENGITKIEYFSPLDIYDENSSQLIGMVMSITRYGNSLYVGTSQGLFYLAPNFEKSNLVPGMSSMCWWLITIDDSILAATSVGVFQVKKSSVRQITSTPSYVLSRSRQDSHRVWAGTRHGLDSLYKNQGNKKSEWEESFGFKKINREVRTIAEDMDGNLWLGTRPSGVIKVDYHGEGYLTDYNITHYDTSHRLPPGEVQVCWAADHVIFGTEQGLIRFDKRKNEFIPETILEETFSSRLRKVFRLVEDKNKTIWFHASGQNYQAILKQDDTYYIDEKSLARIPINAQVNFIYPDPQENVTWFATHKGLIRFDPGIKKNYRTDYYTIIRRVLLGNGTHKLYNVFMPPHSENIKEGKNSHMTTFGYKDRNFRFEFAAPFFEDEDRTMYSYFLEGYGNNWSGWFKETFKDYTNLDTGIYTFRAQAKNVYGHNSHEAVFKFKILPPWYKTWWAYLVYLILLVLTIFLTVRWRSVKLEQEKQKLEQVVVERTDEITRKNQQLEKQTILLIQQADKLKELDHAKSRFFANISHELRTPLTLIIGPLEHILSGILPNRIREKINLTHRNSHRLLVLINRLLDLSRIDSGKMKLKTAPMDIISFVKGILASFRQLSRTKKIEFEFHSEEESITLYFDAEKLEEVFCNLFSNAVKFTPPDGRIAVSVKKIMEKEEDFPFGFLEISIQDTGIGIPKKQLPYIFDRFYQVDSNRQKHKGTGIGLALTRELMILHRGKIDVHSREGENSGTKFILQLPLGNLHLNPSEISSPQESDLSAYEYSQTTILDPGDNREPKPGNAVDKEAIDEWLESEQEIKTKSNQEKLPASKPTIIIVEDNPDMRQFIRESIEPYYKLFEAENGQEGVKKTLSIMPDLVISDIMMPGMDGYDLCKKLKSDIKTSHIPVILLTAKASEDSIVQGLETGADDYIIKPFSTRILLTRIRNLIDLRRQFREKIQRQMLLQPVEIKISSLDQKFLEKLQEVIEKYLSDPELNVESLSKKMKMSRVTLNKKILALTNETANQFIRSYRLKRAVPLLEANFGTILQVAMEVGFSSSAYFTNCFKEKFQRLPSEFLGRGSHH